MSNLTSTTKMSASKSTQNVHSMLSPQLQPLLKEQLHIKCEMVSLAQTLSVREDPLPFFSRATGPLSGSKSSLSRRRPLYSSVAEIESEERRADCL